ncbi:MAG: YCF48-related protein [Candidatus Poribacteria bacterium]|nr:YCF48-related protein [Candidatus Poribacteria bacterium]
MKIRMTLGWMARAGIATTLVATMTASAIAQIGVKELRKADADLNYAGIAFANDQVGALFGEQIFEDRKATIAVTADGGKTWSMSKGLAPGRLYGGFFLNAQLGWAVGEQGAVLATKDGGKSWEIQTSKVQNVLYDVYFIDPQHGWAVGDNATVVETTNGGRTWNVRSGGVVTVEVGEGDVRLMSCYFLNAQVGFAAGASTTGSVMKTTDGGKTWTAVLKSEDNLHAISFADPMNGYAVGKFGIVYNTTDGGKTWTQQSFPTEEDLWAISAASPTTAWATGYYGIIGYTTDGGKNWKLVSVNVDMFGKQKPLVQRVKGVVAKGNKAWAMDDFGRVIYLALQ